MIRRRRREARAWCAGFLCGVRTMLSMNGSPAGPKFTPDEYEHILALCTANASTDNASIRTKINAWLESRMLYASQVGARQDKALEKWSPSPPDSPSSASSVPEPGPSADSSAPAPLMTPSSAPDASDPS